MALGDFFRMNMPYGLRRNSKNEWLVFNRDYMPLGWNSSSYKKNINDDESYSEYPVHTKYKGLTDKILTKIASSYDNDSGLRRNELGEINTVFLYHDATNPQSNPKYWNDYFERIKTLSNLLVDQITY